MQKYSLYAKSRPQAIQPAACFRIRFAPSTPNWCGTLATGSVVLSKLNKDAATSDTVEKLKAVVKDLEAGKIHVFSTDSYTVKGEKQTSYKVEGHEVIKDGYFAESDFRSAPYFDVRIDGITELNVDN